MKCLGFLFFLVSAVCGLQRQSLNGQWTVKGTDEGILPATVPGGIFSDLMANGNIEDVFAGTGDANYSWVGETDWTYSTNFTVSEELLGHRIVSVVFEGLDTFATITINGNEVGTTDNMFVRYNFNIKELLQVGSNEIAIRFTSAVNRADEIGTNSSNEYVIPPECPPVEFHGICYANRIRKAQSSFSWDWGPAFASAGIWKDVYLEAFDSAVIDYVLATPFKYPEEDLWRLEVTTFLNGGEIGEITGVVRVTLYFENTTVAANTQFKKTGDRYFEVGVTTNLNVSSNQINLWWPNGYGTPQLYKLIVTFTSDNNEQDEKTARVGFRTVELVQEPLDSGLTFYFKINNQPIFAKGANEIPINILPEKGLDKAIIKSVMDTARDSHMNMLRVWGGGVYESDYFYDLADEYGILIWQDFMFACALYATDDNFLNNVADEVRHQVKRLAGHPSLALWSGNNENEGALADNWWDTSGRFDLYKADYVKLYVDTIRVAVEAVLPSMNFVTSSPTNGLQSDAEGYVSSNPGSSLYGDVHVYNYYLDSWSVTTFPTPRFASEYGYQSMPSAESWLTATDSLENVRPGASFLSNRQHHPNGDTENERLIEIQLNLPNSTSEHYVEAFIYFSQILQAQSIKVQTEHYRAYKGRLNAQGYGYTMGALYWQLNDVWVAPTWSSMDFTGRWKLLQYSSLDFFSPLIITGELVFDSLEIYAILDALEVPNKTVSALIHVYKWDSLEPLADLHYPVTLDTSEAVLVTTFNNVPANLTSLGCGTEATKNCFFHLHLVDEEDNRLTPANYVFPEKLKNSNLVDANVQIASITSADSTGKTFNIEVTTDAVALFVWLDAHQIKGRFSRNGFLDVLPSVTVTLRTEEVTTVEDLTASLTVTHVRDQAWF